MGQAEAYESPKSIDPTYVTSILTDAEQFLSTASRLPEKFDLPNHGNIIRPKYRGKELDDTPVLLFVTGAQLFLL